MLTFELNKDTTKVIGLIKPCHKPNQKPAASGSLLVSSLGPAAHAASSSSAPMISTQNLAPDRIRLSLFMTLAFSLVRCDCLSTGHLPGARVPPVPPGRPDPPGPACLLSYDFEPFRHTVSPLHRAQGVPAGLKVGVGLSYAHENLTMKDRTWVLHFC